MDKQIHAIGKRKEAVARVYVRAPKEEKGKIIVNGRTFENFFPRVAARMIINQPLEATATVDKYDIIINVKGGGPSGQAGAVRHGIARALLKVDPEFRPVLKQRGFLTRDSREVERKKYGLAGARRRFQFSKR